MMGKGGEVKISRQKKKKNSWQLDATALVVKKDLRHLSKGLFFDKENLIKHNMCKEWKQPTMGMTAWMLET